jgi:hypothetical protein
VGVVRTSAMDAAAPMTTPRRSVDVIDLLRGLCSTERS